MIIKRVRKNYMKPALFAGDIVLVRKTNKLQEGDIILFRYSQQHLFARISKINGKKFNIKYDINKRSISKLPRSTTVNEICGIAVFAISTLRIKVISKWLVLVAIVVLSFSLLFMGIGSAGPVTPKPIINNENKQNQLSQELSIAPVEPNYKLNEVLRDVPYCNDNQAMDIYYPRKAVWKTAPVVMYLHGGGWENNTKSSEMNMIELIDELRDDGYAIISIDYRKLPTYSFPAPVQDTLCSLRFLHAESNKLGIDADRIALFGFSAGGHLAAMAGTLDSSNEFSKDMPYQDQSSRVKAVVTLAALLDFDSGLRNNNVLRLRWFLKTHSWQTAAPIYYVSSDDPPFLLVHGMKDEYVSPEQDDLFATKLNEAGVANEIIHVDNAQHGLGEVGGTMSMSRADIGARIRQFIKQQTNGE